MPEDKPFYLSKTVLSAVALAAIAVYQGATGNVVPEFVYALAGAFGLYGLRDKLGKL